MIERSYGEAPPAPDLAAQVRCVWFRRVGQAEAARPVRIVPDGCRDLIWRYGGGHGALFVAGPDTTAQVSRMPAGTAFVGLRFTPGAAAAVLGVPASELVDARPDAGALWGRAAGELIRRLEGAGSTAAAAALLEDAVRRRLVVAPPPDPVVQQVVASLERGPRRGLALIEQLARRIGISERQLHRRCRAALGYGPRTFAGIARFQRFLALAGDPGPRSLAALAAESGYADQPHLSREVGRLTGLTPARLLAEHAG
jgi:AraC-like DNA-binding protein